jgi:hypothetical protein
MRRQRDTTIHRRLAELLAEASAPDTPPDRFYGILQDAEETLTDLGKRQERFRADFTVLRAAIIQHPNIPPEMLHAGYSASLIEEYPNAFLANPAAPLLPLESPTFINAIGHEAMLRLLVRADVPLIYVAAGRTYYDAGVREAAANHIHAEGELPSGGAEWKAKARDMISGLYLWNYETPTIWEMIETGLAPAWLGERLLESGLTTWWRDEPPPDTPAARARALNPRTPLETLKALSRSSEVGVLLAVWFNPTTPESIRHAMRAKLLQWLLSNVSPGWEYKTPTLLTFLALATMSRDARYVNEFGKEGKFIFDTEKWDCLYPATRLALAVNPHTPLAMREQFATRDGHRVVRAAAQSYLRHGRTLL